MGTPAALQGSGTALGLFLRTPLRGASTSSANSSEASVLLAVALLFHLAHSTAARFIAARAAMCDRARERTEASPLGLVKWAKCVQLIQRLFQRGTSAASMWAQSCASIAWNCDQSSACKALASQLIAQP